MATKGIRQKVKMFDLPIFDNRILMIYFKDYKYANKHLKNNGFKSQLDEDDAGMVHEENIEKEDKTIAKRFIVAIQHTDDITDLKKTVVHETFHLTQYILEHIGIPFKKGGTNEAYTYLHSYLQDVIENFITT